MTREEIIDTLEKFFAEDREAEAVELFGPTVYAHEDYDRLPMMDELEAMDLRDRRMTQLLDFQDKWARLAAEKRERLASAASALGRKGGRARSEAKAKAARENGKKGGRPRKSEKE